jgi:hypothetical protein
VIKIYRFWGSKNDVINCSKTMPKSQFSTGGPGGPKWSKIDLGDPGPSKRNFLKFCSFLQKLPHFSTPKSTTINGPIKMPFPTKTPVLLLRGGSKNVTFWGVGGRTARTEKCRHYYIAKTGNRGPKKSKFIEFSPPRGPPRKIMVKGVKL